MRAGNLREKVTFQRRGTGSDGAGNFTTAFADLAGAIDVPAQLRPVRQAEAGTNQGVRPVLQLEVLVRWTSALAGIQVGDRMRDARTSAIYAVVAPPANPDQRTRELRLIVEAGGADG